MWNKNVETFLCCNSDYERSSIVLYGAPFDGTVSFRPGARFGPSSMRHESYGLESYSPYLNKDLSDISVFDGGDLELGFGNPSRVLDEIEEKTDIIFSDGKLPFLLGGEHLITLGAFRSAVKRYPGIMLLHLDAHADLRDKYLGEELSHACVIRRCHELAGDGRIIQLGIRSGDRSEFEWSSQGHTEMHRFSTDSLPEVISRLTGRPVYLTVDLDILDPSVFPGTGTPEAGGISFEELRKAVTDICLNCSVVGCDVVELSPGYSPADISVLTGGKIVREMLLALAH
ncbi:MAG: agmatinase [Oscillospiraceae bacterium]|jgi:agmatinase